MAGGCPYHLYYIPLKTKSRALQVAGAAFEMLIWFIFYTV